MSDSRIEPPLKVLIADCGTAFKQSAAEALTRKGFAVELAEAAEQAFEKVRTFLPNLIFYDLDLPGYDGFEALTLVGKMRAGKEAFLIASSFHKGGQYAEKAAASGAWHYVHKPVDSQALTSIAASVKRHIGRPKSLPKYAENPAIEIVSMKCRRPGCKTSLAAFRLKPNSMVEEADQFETPLYREAAREGEPVDYNRLAVAVCPSCYFAFDSSAKPDKEARADEYPKTPWLPRLFLIAAGADDTLFEEHRTAEAALCAYRLAAECVKARECEPTAAELEKRADLFLKAGAAAGAAGEGSQQDKFFAEAERIVDQTARLQPCAAVYRALYRLVALYVFFTRDADAAKAFASFDRCAKPAGGRTKPRDAAVLQKYRQAAAAILADRDLYRRSTYLAH